MKKIVVTFILIALGAILALAQENKNLTNQVQRAVQTAAVNSGAAESNRTLYFILKETVRHELNGTEGTYHAAYHCKAYALDEHWYILAGTCGNSIKADVGHNDKNEYTRRGLTLLAEDGTELKYKKNKHLMLLHDEKFIPGLYVNVLATSSPVQLFTLTADKYTAVINTSRFGLNKVVTRELKPKSILSDSFQLEEGTFDLSGTATDPLFLISPEQNTFLAGYNKAPMVYYFYDHPGQVRGNLDPRGDRSSNWFSLTEEDLKFIKESIQKDYPEDWKRIKARLFLDQTQTPYFK